MYMTTLGDLNETIMNAARHLKTGGILLVVADREGDFRENTFSCSGEEENVHVTVFEDNHIVSNSIYEAAIACLIRQEGELYALTQDHIRRTADEANLRIITEAKGRWVAEDVEQHKPEILITQELQEALEGCHIEAWPVSPTGREYSWFIAED